MENKREWWRHWAFQVLAVVVAVLVLEWMSDPLFAALSIPIPDWGWANAVIWLAIIAGLWVFMIKKLKERQQSQ